MADGSAVYGCSGTAFVADTTTPVSLIIRDFAFVHGEGIAVYHATDTAYALAALFINVSVGTVVTDDFSAVHDERTFVTYGTAVGDIPDDVTIL